MSPARFVSYAQNREDVVLSRLLRFVPEGRYVDVGAGHPVFENVTYGLYLRGWRGINVEPMAREAALLRDTRPDDVTLQVALGAHPGRVTLHEAPLENRGATTSAAEEVERYASVGQQFEPFEVEMTTLSSVLGQWQPGEVHVVKIDVEGMETEVLAGGDLAVHRPWVLVIEATRPNRPERSDAAWESTVLSAGYVSTLFDGLNRFFVRDDLDDLIPVLSVPANVFDDWVSATEVERDSLRLHAAELERELRDAHELIEVLQRELEHARADARNAAEYAVSLRDVLEAREAELANALQVISDRHSTHG